MAKKLIEVALPLEKINAESAREKSIRHGHPSTLHLWWARRPLAAARAVIWASLVDDPSAHPELYKTEEEQSAERKRLFKILEDLVVWENSKNNAVLDIAKKEILKSTNGVLPEFLDPFAGGGAIPLEAHRLGLVSHAHDLNPVAVMINKAMIEIPPRFAGKAPVNPESRTFFTDVCNLKLVHGLSEDVRYYGSWMEKEAYKLIGEYYPQVRLPREYDGDKAIVIAWIWTRTTICSNPLCRCEVPLAGSFVLSKKKGNEAWIEPKYVNDHLVFDVHKGKCPKGKETNKQGRSAVFRCLKCGTVTTDEYVKNQGKSGNIHMKMMAVVAKGNKGRIYLPVDTEQKLASNVARPLEYPTGNVPTNPRWFSPPAFGMTDFSDLFTNRQLLALTTFSNLVFEAQKKAEADAIDAGYKNDYIGLQDGGDGARAYGEAVGVYLAFLIDKMTTRLSAFCNWDNGYTKISNMFSRQALPMVWDFAEGNVFSGSTGSVAGTINFITKAIDEFPVEKAGFAEQLDAQSDCGLRNIMISTDPPYYDNIGYADLSDFMYIWMRQSLKKTYPQLLSTMLVPKTEELIATPHRFNGSMDKAKEFFEEGMSTTCKQLYRYACEDIPVTIYYAYKQSDSKSAENSSASSGWETMLSAIINAGFMITGTWPIRTELITALKSRVNALASSIVLVCRKRSLDAPQIIRRNFVNILRKELRPALIKLQQSNIAPVDLAQSAIGPGMGVFSRYKQVLESDGTSMSVRSALQLINQEIDLYLNEQVGDMDAASRFCIDLYTQNAYNDIKYGEAEVLANAKGASIPLMAARGVLYAKAGNVHLIERNELSEEVDTNENNIWMLTQQLTHAMAIGGVEACAKIVASMFGSNAERAKDLAYRLYTIAEQKKWANEAYAYNALVVAWPDIQSRAASMKEIAPEQLNLFDLMDDSQ